MNAEHCLDSLIIWRIWVAFTDSTGRLLMAMTDIIPVKSLSVFDERSCSDVLLMCRNHVIIQFRLIIKKLFNQYLSKIF